MSIRLFCVYCLFDGGQTFRPEGVNFELRTAPFPSSTGSPGIARGHVMHLMSGLLKGLELEKHGAACSYETSGVRNC
jgi:hypothetical protein